MKHFVVIALIIGLGSVSSLMQLLENTNTEKVMARVIEDPSLSPDLPLNQGGEVRHVDAAGGNDSGDCIDSPCQTIGYALSQANGGDTVMVASGIYVESLTLDKVVSLLGEGADQTSVVALDSQRVMTITGATINSSTVISGFTFKNGTLSNGSGAGLLIINSTPTIRNNYIVSNTITGNDGDGAGLYVQNSSGLILQHNVIAHNRTALGDGGGACLDDSPNAILTNNIISDNLAAYQGGGICLTNSNNVTLTGNVVISNLAGTETLAHFARGGGLYIENSSGLYLAGNLVVENRSYARGAGSYLQNSTARLTNDVIRENEIQDESFADPEGSGMHARESDVSMLHVTMDCNGVDGECRGQHGSGIYIGGANSTLMLTNTILINHATGINDEGSNSSIIVNGILWHGNTTNYTSPDIMVTNEHTGDPAFHADGYHLTSESAAKDMGVDSGIAEDIDGDSRPAGAGYDLGADEFISLLPPTLSSINNGDGDGDYLVEWSTMPGVLTYTLQEADSATFSPSETVYTGPATQYQVTDQLSGTWYYRIKALNNATESPWSSPVSITVNNTKSHRTKTYLPSISYQPITYFEGPWEEEPNDSITSANGRIRLNQTYFGVFTTPITDMHDIFYFELFVPMTVELSLTNIPSGQDFNLTLWKDEDTPIDHSGEIGNADEHIGSIHLNAGKYYVQVVRFTEHPSNQPYHLLVEE